MSIFSRVRRPVAEAVGTGRVLPFPATRETRVAMLGERAQFDHVRSYSDDRWHEIPSFAPQILVGDVKRLIRISHHIFRGTITFSSLDRAVFALTHVGQVPIKDDQRERLWRAFHVPMYELYVDEEAGMLAGECEAYSGWHVRHPKLRFDLRTGAILFQKHGLAASPVPTGLTAEGLDGCCACDDPSPLLRDVRSAQALPILVRTAIA
jgi:hypothetical protein